MVCVTPQSLNHIVRVRFVFFTSVEDVTLPQFVHWFVLAGSFWLRMNFHEIFLMLLYLEQETVDHILGVIQIQFKQFFSLMNIVK